MKTAITKILDIDHRQLTPELIKALEFCACYTDEKTAIQHLYNSFDILEGDFIENSLDRHTLDILQEIEQLCVVNGCDYFRITY